MPADMTRLVDEKAIEQLVAGTGRMAELGSENGVPKLDWVMGVARLLENDTWLEQVEREAADIWNRGIRHVIWSGMGGSIMAVRVLVELGCFSGAADTVAVHPLDSTDPAALNALVRGIAELKQQPLVEAEIDRSPEHLRDLLSDVMMVAVSMGMTSEEPITHLEWFTELLTQAGLPIDRHCLVMTLPGSYLERFALDHGCPSLPLQLDGGSGTGGRMSAPATRVFLLPAALALGTQSWRTGRLRLMLQAAWATHGLARATDHPANHPYVRLAVAMSEAAVDGVCRLMLGTHGAWQALIPWIEQLMEESLGKGGKGVVVFADTPLNANARCYRADGMMRAHIGSGGSPDDPALVVVPVGPITDSASTLSSVAAAFLGWQLSMALYGYLHDIQFAGQPAVEDYKARARALRTERDPVQIGSGWGTILRDGSLSLLSSPDRDTAQSSAALIAAALRSGCPSYLDLTVNGEPAAALLAQVAPGLEYLANRVLGIPVKLRRAPAAYHSTEQSEMDGPPGLVSIRILASDHESALLGRYDATFLAAQAVGTWQAMVEAGRTCYLMVVDGTLIAGLPVIAELLADIAARITHADE
jgi:hypothetical protein